MTIHSDQVCLSSKVTQDTNHAHGTTPAALSPVLHDHIGAQVSSYRKVSDLDVKLSVVVTAFKCPCKVLYHN